MKHRPRPRQLAALGGLVALTVTAFALPHRNPPAYTPRIDPAAVTHREAQRAMLLIGDSYAGGAAGVRAGETFPWLACRQLTWVCHVDGQGGTGYRADGHADTATFRPYGGRVSTDRSRYEAEVVVVTGGRNDATPAGEYAAARKLFSDLTRAYPRAAHVVVEPFWVGAKPPPAFAALRTAVQKAARDGGFTWVESDDWLDSSLVAADGVNPTRQGHEALANHLAESLRDVDVPEPAPDDEA